MQVSLFPFKKKKNGTEIVQSLHIYEAQAFYTQGWFSSFGRDRTPCYPLDRKKEKRLTSLHLLRRNSQVLTDDNRENKNRKKKSHKVDCFSDIQTCYFGRLKKKKKKRRNFENCATDVNKKRESREICSNVKETLKRRKKKKKVVWIKSLHIRSVYISGSMTLFHFKMEKTLHPPPTVSSVQLNLPIMYTNGCIMCFKMFAF